MSKYSRGGMPLLVAFSVAACVCATPVWAKKPPSNGSAHKQQHSEKSSERGEREHHADHQDDGQGFNDDRRSRIQQYYASERNAGNCPPGLAKKNNGCQAPGQARKWKKGYPLPNDVVYHDLPSALLRELGRTPEGQKFVRIGTDILLVTVGSGMVIDAMEDLGGLF